MCKKLNCTQSVHLPCQQRRIPTHHSPIHAGLPQQSLTCGNDLMSSPSPHGAPPTDRRSATVALNHLATQLPRLTLREAAGPNAPPLVVPRYHTRRSIDGGLTPNYPGRFPFAIHVLPTAPLARSSLGYSAPRIQNPRLLNRGATNINGWRIPHHGKNALIHQQSPLPRRLITPLLVRPSPKDDAYHFHRGPATAILRLLRGAVGACRYPKFFPPPDDFQTVGYLSQYGGDPPSRTEKRRTPRRPLSRGDAAHGQSPHFPHVLRTRDGGRVRPPHVKSLDPATLLMDHRLSNGTLRPRPRRHSSEGRPRVILAHHRAVASVDRLQHGCLRRRRAAPLPT